MRWRIDDAPHDNWQAAIVSPIITGSEFMPLIKARTNRVKTLRHICRLQEPNRNTLMLYARFIGDTPDYVLNRLIETTIGRDRDFVAWRAEQPAATSDIPAGVRRSGRSATDPEHLA